MVTGRAVALMAAGIVAVALAPATATVLAWAVLVVLACAADVVLAASPRQVALTRSVPPSVRLTDATTSTLLVTNRSRRRLRGVVRDAWQPSAGAGTNRHPVDLPPGESRRLATPLTPTRRGDRHADKVTVRTVGPLGLAGRQVSLPVPGRLRVLPEFASRRHLPSRLARLRELDGRTAVQVRGAGTEFDSLREYVIGDDVRSIDWRASARATKTMVRTWRPERDRHILLVLDTSRWAAGRIGGDQLRLDAGIEACLLMAALGAASGDRMSLLVADQEVRLRLPGTGRGSVLAAFADGLSLIEPALTETDWSLVAGQVDALCRQRSLVVLVTGLDPALYAEGLGTVLAGLAHDHQVMIAHVTDPAGEARPAEAASASTAYDAAATGRLWLATQALSARVQRMGVDVVRADPDHLAPAVCDAYLALKAAGRL